MKKLYICVLDSFPDYMTPTLVSHAVLRHSITYRNYPEYIDWEINSLKSVWLGLIRKNLIRFLNYLM